MHKKMHIVAERTYKLHYIRENTNIRGNVLCRAKAAYKHFSVREDLHENADVLPWTKTFKEDASQSLIERERLASREWVAGMQL